MMNEMIALEQKVLSYMDTFTANSGREVAKQLITDALKKDAVEQKMLELRRNNKSRIYREELSDADPYETAAAAFYRKYGTRGEF